MAQPMKFTVEPIWQVVIRDLGIDPVEVLKRAELPLDLFRRRDASLTIAEYFHLWSALEAASDDPALPLKIGRSIPVEAFNPPLFAALCSPNFNTAVQRLSTFKALCGPMTITVETGREQTCVVLGCRYTEYPMPRSMAAVELVFLTELARMATRERIVPLRVGSVSPIPAIERYGDYFGVIPEIDEVDNLVLSAADARLPFLTENEAMWRTFKPELRQRLTTLDAEANFASKVRGALLELLPGGRKSAEDVARKLAVSKRTLQRRLNEETTTFQRELNQVREGLARHYLVNTELPGAQISFLLGFEDPNSFFRAFHGWTGKTPEAVRAAR
jgi:AraC-like DNA-binding protein